MAIIKNSVLLGNATGTLGDFVVKNFRGKKILAVKTRTYTASKSALAVKGRNNFAAAVSLAKTANSQPAIKEIWELAKVDASSPYQKMIKNNVKKVSNGSLTTKNMITPEGLPLTLSSVSVQNNILKLNFNMPLIDNIQFPAKVFIFCRFNKYDKSIFIINTEIAEPSPDGSYTEDITIDSNIKKALKADANPVIYLAIAGSTPYKKKEFWTSTAAAQL